MALKTEQYNVTLSAVSWTKITKDEFPTWQRIFAQNATGGTLQFRVNGGSGANLLDGEQFFLESIEKEPCIDVVEMKGTGTINVELQHIPYIGYSRL